MNEVILKFVLAMLKTELESEGFKTKIIDFDEKLFNTNYTWFPLFCNHYASKAEGGEKTVQVFTSENLTISTCEWIIYLIKRAVKVSIEEEGYKFDKTKTIMIQAKMLPMEAVGDAIRFEFSDGSPIDSKTTELVSV